jgi:hypothetical protein
VRRPGSVLQRRSTLFPNTFSVLGETAGVRGSVARMHQTHSSCRQTWPRAGSASRLESNSTTRAERAFHLVLRTLFGDDN